MIGRRRRRRRRRGGSQWRRRKSIPRDGRRRDAGVRVPSEMAKQLKKKLGKKNSVNVWSVTAGPKMGPKKRKKTKQNNSSLKDARDAEHGCSPRCSRFSPMKRMLEPCPASAVLREWQAEDSRQDASHSRDADLTFLPEYQVETR